LKIFLDTASIESIKKFVDMGIVDGITTNPTLISREKGHPEDIMREIVKIVKGPVNLEVVATNTDDMVEEGLRLKKFGENKYWALVVQGFDMDSDGKIDAIDIVDGISANSL